MTLEQPTAKDLSSDHPLAPTPQSGFRTRRITMGDGKTMHVRDYGNPLAAGTPVLCLGGLTRNARDFHDLALALSNDRRVICPDYIGRGRSDWAATADRYAPPAMLGDILTVKTALNLHHCIAIGTSLGGFLTMGLAVLAPTFLKAAVINDVGPDFGAAALDRIADYVGRDHPQPSWDAAMQHIKAGFPQLGFEDEQDWRDMVEGTFQPRADNHLHNAWDLKLVETLKNNDHGFDLWALFRALTPRPVLAFRGENSDALMPETFEKMAKTMPQMTAITVANRAHTPTLREPEARSAIATFVNEVDGLI
ncbi:MAG: alpha/beta hydrolase [Pseudomonadota bacterium]